MHLSRRSSNNKAYVSIREDSVPDAVGYLPRAIPPIFFLGKDLEPCFVLNHHVLPGTFSCPGMKANYSKQSRPFILLTCSEFTQGHMAQLNLPNDIRGEFHWKISGKATCPKK